MLPELLSSDTRTGNQTRALRLVEGEDLYSIYQAEQPWGLLTSLDIYDCQPEIIRDGQAIARFAVELCRLIDMKTYGDPQVVHFGEGKVGGYSLVQLIETSLISGHFAEESNRAFIDIFSCKFYNPGTAAKFSVDFFGGSGHTINCILRK